MVRAPLGFDVGFDVALDFSVGMCILHDIWGPNDGFAMQARLLQLTICEDGIVGGLI